ncbi:MAG: phenylalanine 4-monooxygenase [Candidatus Latescibacterota bacterium]|jgi:phenylalanine-4-hydroxylase
MDSPELKSQDSPISAYEKAAEEGVDPRCIPQSLEEEPPVGSEIEYPGYPDSDHEIWRTLFERQKSLLPGRAAEAYLDGIDILGLQNDRIPALRDLSEALDRATGWKVARIPGLLHEKDFFGLLARRVFPSTDYIRGVEELDYTPAPDLFHDIFGHMPMLTDPDFADFYHRFGQAALNAKGADRISLERLHWFTVEFGLVDQAIGRRIYGAGILSSKEEVRHALSEEVTVHRFDPDRVTEQDYEVWHLQDVLFVVDSFAELESGFKDWTFRRGLT